MSRNTALASFVESAPPGELTDVTKAIQSILGDNAVQAELLSAFERYNEEQLTTVTLPGSGGGSGSGSGGSSSSSSSSNKTDVLVSSYNSLGQGRYYDVESRSSFAFDHASGKASSVQSHVLESQQEDMIKSMLKCVGSHVAEHYPHASYAVFPTADDSALAILTVANKYSPSNYWTGRWRSCYTYRPSDGSVHGSIKVDVHYYEDGNVRLLTDKPVRLVVGGGSTSASASEVVRRVAAEEQKYQEDLNKAFASLSEGAFKALRRQLPITRQKIEWEKISGYRLGQDLGGGRR